MDTILTEEQKEYYFSELDKFFLKEQKEKKKEKYICCNKQELIKDNTGLTCYKCGKTFLDNFEYVIPNTYLNQKFHNCTLINPSVKFKNIRRLHHFSCYNYLEVIMSKSFKEISRICLKLGLSKKIIEGSKIKYKQIFIDERISSRSNIKRAMYSYCIYFSCNYYNIDIDIDELIKISNIEEKHYNKVIKKLEKKNMLFKSKKVKQIIKICEDNNINIDLEILRNKYNELKKKKIKLNNNSIILGLLYDMIKIEEKMFINIFKTTKITLKKYNKLINQL